MIVLKQITVIDQKATAKKMRAFRIASGISLRKVAERMFVSAAFLSDLERGNRNWNTTLADKYTRAINALGR